MYGILSKCSPYTLDFMIQLLQVSDETKKMVLDNICYLFQ